MPIVHRCISRYRDNTSPTVRYVHVRYIPVCYIQTLLCPSSFHPWSARTIYRLGYNPWVGGVLLVMTGGDVKTSGKLHTGRNIQGRNVRGCIVPLPISLRLVSPLCFIYCYVWHFRYMFLLDVLVRSKQWFVSIMSLQYSSSRTVPCFDLEIGNSTSLLYFQGSFSKIFPVASLSYFSYFNIYCNLKKNTV